MDRLRRYDGNVKRYAPLAAAVIILLSFGILQYEGYRSMRRLESAMTRLTARVDDASRSAAEASSAAVAAGEQANEAAARAQIAAGAKLQAEQLKQQAEAGQAQAQSAAAQAQTEAARAAQKAQQAQTELTQIRQEREQEMNRMQEALNRIVETKRTQQGMTIILPDSSFKFGFDSAELSQRNRELLSRIAGILLVSKGYGLSVFGYTDDVGSADYNQQLSLRRAKAVEQYLVQSGIDSSIINRRGFGKTSPMVAGNSESARAKNRRVEIALTDTEIKYVGEEPSTVH